MAYTKNHYVPQWFQRRFLAPGETKLWLLDMKPPVYQTPAGPKLGRSLRHEGPGNCFYGDNLYRTSVAGANEDIEKYLFGRIEPPRLFRRLHPLRGWSHEQTDAVLT